jgi:APA family basic amino acid/polyamine antiporter
VAIVTTASMHLLCRKQFRKAQGYGVPLFPWVPAASVFLNTFLLGQLGKPAYERFGIWTAAVTGECSVLRFM